LDPPRYSIGGAPAVVEPLAGPPPRCRPGPAGRGPGLSMAVFSRYDLTRERNAEVRDQLASREGQDAK
jgi:hypothetical protein